MKKQQQWWLLFKVFSSSSKTTLTPPPPLINSSSSSSTSSYIARCLRSHPFCSLAATTTNTSLFAAVKKNLPLLIVPYHDDDDKKNGIDDGGGSSSRVVYDDTIGFTCLFDDDDDDDDEINKKKKKKKKALVHKMYLPEITDRRICGSSEGWLITVHENTEVQLLNPFSKVLVNLPPLITSFPGFVGKLDVVKENYKGLCYILHEDYESPKGYDSHYFLHEFFKKVVTSTTTTTVVIMAIYGEAMKLAFCRPFGINDDEKWMSCLQGDRGNYTDVTFYKGNFYAVNRYGDVVVVKGLDGPSPFVETIINQLGPDFNKYPNYLVESSTSSSSSSSTGRRGDGDLLKVIRSIKHTYKEEQTYRTTRFKVLKLDFNGGGGPASLVEVTNLGDDCALFIGYNHSFSFSASKIPGCRGNCIYFTFNNVVESYKFGEEFYNFEGHDMGVYNLEDGSIEKLNYETTGSFMPPPIWYVPSPHN